MKFTARMAIAALALTAGTAMATTEEYFGSTPTAPASAVVSAAAKKFQTANPESRFYWTGGQVSTIYGQSFSQGTTAQSSVDAFLARNLAVFGITKDQLIPGSLASDNAAVRPIMPDLETGTMKFLLHSYVQAMDGIPVYRGEIKLLVRNEPSFPLVLARSSLRELGRYRIDQTVAANPNLDAAFAAAAERIDGITDWGTPELVIWAGMDEQKVNPTLTLKFTVTAGEPWDAGYAKWMFLADAKTGAIVHAENQVHNVDVSGNTSAIVTAGKKADICETEVSRPMPYTRVTIGATIAYADAAGNFTIPNAGSTAVTVAAGMRGRWFRVYNPSVDAPGLSGSFTPPGPANFVFNSANTDALRRAEANAYYHSNVVRDFMLSYAPTHPTIGTQTEFRVNTGVSGTCNAFYDGGSINFYNAGGGCSNTAFGDVVWHEYGHHLVQTGGSSQNAYGEGYGDLIGVMISDEPVLGYGFQNNCSAGIRTAVNNIQYPCAGEIHECGQLLTGAFWETRNELLATNPSNYRDIIASLACNSVVLHNNNAIDPQITIDVLTLDDNNANIGDGTPHYTQIAQGFGEHNLDAPPLQLLNFNYPSGRPALVSPFGGVAFTVQVTNLSATAQPNTGVLMVDAENDGSYVSYAMNQTSPNTYEANFPAIDCGNTVRYYVTAKTTTNITVANPTGAPGSYYTAISAAGTTTAFTDNFQTNKNWVATVVGATAGQWQRATPNGGGVRGDPATDYDGSGLCYVTQNGSGDTDVDGGSVILTSPTMNATGGEAFLSYARWYDNTGSGTGADPNNDLFVVEVSNNNGSTWVNLETVGPAVESSGGWYHKTFKLSSKLALTSTMKVRFNASDLNSGSVVEAGVDAVNLLVVTDCGSCPADFDGSGFVDLDDYDAFVEAFELGGDDADFDGSGFVDIDDFDAFVEAFELGC